MIGLFELIILAFVFLLAPWLIAFIDILKNEFTDNNKLIWILVILLVPFVGPITYFIIGRKQKINHLNHNSDESFKRF